MQYCCICLDGCCTTVLQCMLLAVSGKEICKVGTPRGGVGVGVGVGMSSDGLALPESEVKVKSLGRKV